MEIIGYLAASLIGISLGLIGGGGSILTVPVLVYLFKIDVTHATSYSLFIIGVTSLVGAFRSYKKGLVNIKTALLFGLPSITTVFVSRMLLLPAIPRDLFVINGFTITKSFATMMLFALLMLFSSFSMIRSSNKNQDRLPDAIDKSFIIKLLSGGIGVGLVTGLLGAGGGFLLIPVLVLLFKMPMKAAVGTSLFIIALNSMFGFTGDIGHLDINWRFLAALTTIAAAGVFVGGSISKKIDGLKLKKGFGWFVLIMAVYILIKETLSTL